jgi:Tfp pilus assembly protein PilF
VLGRWWASDDVPTETRLVRATIRQSFHDFPRALADLDAVVAADPGDAQAWLTRATVLQVLARLDEAEESCRRLVGASRLVFTVCQAQVDGLRGTPAKGREALTGALASATADEQGWARSVLGDLALWAGDADAAIANYQLALRLDPSDEYTRGALADLLLDLRRPHHVVELLREHTAIDAQLLRLTIAAREVHDEHLSTWRRDLAERIDAGRARQDVVHRREEARYALELEGDAERALALAEANFQVQKEPADARVLLEAARAAKHPARAQPALAWLSATGFADPALRRLATQVAP